VILSKPARAELAQLDTYASGQAFSLMLHIGHLVR
jgi:hypothetical protein